MVSEVGSFFWVTPKDLEGETSLDVNTNQFGCSGNDYVWLSTGRSAISYVLQDIENRNPSVRKVAVLPSFTCQTVIEPFLSMGYEIHTYHIGRDLLSSVLDIWNAVDTYNPGIFLFHRLFGVDTIKGIDMIIPQMRSKGIIVVEDCTQCLYSGFKKTDADYWVGSVRKWSGVFDGGFAACREGLFYQKPTLIDEKLQDAKRVASKLKYEYLFEGKGDKSVYLNKYRESEEILSTQGRYYAISDLSISILSNLDVQELVMKRRENYKFISESLIGCTDVKVVFDKIEKDEVPLYCPILCRNRDEVQKKLIANNVYAPVVWPKADCCSLVDSDADYIYEHVLCIPIDQRYDVYDMKRVIDVIKSN